MATKVSWYMVSSPVLASRNENVASLLKGRVGQFQFALPIEASTFSCHAGSCGQSKTDCSSHSFLFDDNCLDPEKGWEIKLCDCC